MTEPRLKCFEGEAAPLGLAADVRAILQLSHAAQQNLWRSVSEVLADPVPANASQVLERHAAETESDLRLYARAVSAARALFRNAAGLDLSRELLAADLTVLAGLGAKNDASSHQAQALTELLLPSYDLARARVQAELAGTTLRSHGKVLVDVDWRFGLITQSNHGRGLKLPLVTLTLHWEEHGARGATTVDVLPTMLRKLRDTLSQIVT